jgi:UPF0716 protein FxsA
MRFIFLLFIIVPITEMWVLIEVGSKIGALPTIFLVFFTAAVGLALLRQQGLSTLLRVNQRMEQGQLPAAEILEGVMLAVGGVLLLTPGFVTDFVGFACLLPPSRKVLVASLLRQGVMMASYGASAAAFQRGPSAQPTDQGQYGSVEIDRQGKNTLEGEYHREE